ncbi:SMP-30/gluconolactonase/LRE family protein [Mycolicibacterium austroafricanum]|uniref:SMP-30/gluconolactonase/LRE family protein n=2 Tax=Mycolicibacterium austroafricanum TaxID=39687 RepID=UPI002ADDEE9D|nr:SMP-30/gluconolactonase/LRE family protein [Mycolicibacterium austroafricanum]
MRTAVGIIGANEIPQGISMRCAERLTESFAYHGEGPFWDSRSGRLLCMDVLAPAVVAVGGDGVVERYAVPGRVATVIRRRVQAGFIVATEHGLAVVDDSLSNFESIAEVVDDPTVRTNDGGCDPLGNFIIGTMAHDGRPGAGAVYRVTPDREVTPLLSPVSISNGVQWSADGTRVFYVDSPTRRVDLFTVDPQSGAWLDRRTHIDLGDVVQGVPDGMAIDEAGGLWIALWGAGAVNHYDEFGRLVETIVIPGVSQPSSCAFGGDDYRVLFVTTSRQGLPRAHEPDAGAVFVIGAGIRGATQGEFGG